MDKCKSNIVWKFGPLFKAYGDHFYLIEEVYQVLAHIISLESPFILVKRCQNCRERKDIVNVSGDELEELVKEFPMAFNRDTLRVLKNELPE